MTHDNQEQENMPHNDDANAVNAPESNDYQESDVTPISGTEELSAETLAGISALEAHIAQLEVEAVENKDKMLRAMAEADNTRRRAEKERADTAKYAVSGFAKNLLPAIDNFRRALDAIPAELREGNPEIENLTVGIEATEREMLRAFESAHIKAIDALDKPFDPNFHEVMFEAEIEGKPAGIVFQVLETGYTIHDRLLRPARVGVTKGGVAVKSVDEAV